MIPIFVLNLERRPDRKEKLISQFKKYGITNYKFITSCDGGLKEDYNEIINSYNKKHAIKINRDLTPFEIATSISHKKAYKLIVENNISGAIVLEDDAILSNEFASIAKGEFLLDTNLDIINFDYYTSNSVPFPGDNTYNLENKSSPNIRYLQDDTVISKIYFLENVDDTQIKLYTPKYPSLEIDFLHGLHGYFITNQGAKKFLKFNTPVIVESDNIWNYFHEYIQGKVIYPPIISTLRKESDVDKGRKIKQNQVDPNDKNNVLYLKRLNHPHFKHRGDIFINKFK